LSIYAAKILLEVHEYYKEEFELGPEYGPDIKLKDEPYEQTWMDGCVTDRSAWCEKAKDAGNEPLYDREICSDIMITASCR